jgi:hypothetical protein
MNESIRTLPESEAVTHANFEAQADLSNIFDLGGSSGESLTLYERIRSQSRPSAASILVKPLRNEHSHYSSSHP